MVSKARLDLPEPETPVTTVMASWGISKSMFFRLWTRAPLTTMDSVVGGRSGTGATKFGLHEDAAPQCGQGHYAKTYDYKVRLHPSQRGPGGMTGACGKLKGNAIARRGSFGGLQASDPNRAGQRRHRRDAGCGGMGRRRERHAGPCSGLEAAPNNKPGAVGNCQHSPGAPPRGACGAGRLLRAGGASFSRKRHDHRTLGDGPDEDR